MRLLQNKIFLAQIVAHLSVIPMIVWAKPLDYAVSLFVYFLTGCIGMSVTYHRLIAHRSFCCAPIFKYLGLFCGTIGLMGSALAWCGVHREHHAFADSAKDPHSPHFRGILWVALGSMFFRPNTRFIKSLLNDPAVVFFHRNYFKINFVYALGLLLIDPFAVIYAYLFPAFLLWHASGMINVFGHIWGYRNFDTNDRSRNNPVCGFLMWGEGWHNNHHRHPDRPKFRERWFELDVSYLFIRLIARSKEYGRAQLVKPATAEPTAQ